MGGRTSKVCMRLLLTASFLLIALIQATLIPSAGSRKRRMVMPGDRRRASTSGATGRGFSGADGAQCRRRRLLRPE